MPSDSGTPRLPDNRAHFSAPTLRLPYFKHHEQHRLLPPVLPTSHPAVCDRGQRICRPCRNLIRHFTAQGIQVVAALTRSADARRTVQELGAQAFDGDLFSPDLTAGMTGCQALVHTAADTDHGPPTRAQYRTNVEGTRQILEAGKPGEAPQLQQYYC